MPAGRPKQYSRLSIINVSLDGKDLDFLDDHRGDIPRGKFLIHCMYTSRNEVNNLETEFNKLKKRIEELEHENRNLKAIKGTQTTLNNTCEAWWHDKEHSIKDALKRKFEPDWEKLYLVAIQDYPGISWNNSKEVKNFVTMKIKNNGTEV